MRDCRAQTTTFARIAVVSALGVWIAACEREDPGRSASGSHAHQPASPAHAEPPQGTLPEAAPPAPRADAEPTTPPTSKVPTPVPALLRQAYALLAQHQFKPARDLAAHYAERNPDDARAPFIIAMSYHQADNHAPALPYFEESLELDPDDALTHRYYAECLFMLGDMTGARREYESYAGADPGDPVGPYSIGLVDLEEAHLDGAEERFRESLALFDRLRSVNPRYYAALSGARARCHARLADVHFARDEYEAARDELLASTTIEPRNISAYFALSTVYRRLGNDELAKQALAHYEAAKQAIVDAQTGGGG